MKYYKICVIVIAVILLGSGLHHGSVSAAQDARNAWASVAGNYNFDVSTATAQLTFEDIYLGDNLSADFAGAIGATADLMGTATPPLEVDDIIDASLHNWPDE